MIKLFRHIRKSLFMENKTGKYLKYAIGEIALVMIGILLAIQANNWNVNRIAKIELNQSLEKLLVELKKDIVDLNDEMIANNSYISALDSCLIILKNPKNYSIDQFDEFFHFTNYTSTFSYNRITYDELSSSGKLKQIKNSKLSDSLISYYSYNKYQNVEAALADHVRDNIRMYTLDFDFMHLNDDLDTYKASDFGIKSKTLEDYRSDVRIINVIRFKMRLHRFIDLNYNSIIQRTKNLVGVVEQELE